MSRTRLAGLLVALDLVLVACGGGSSGGSNGGGGSSSSTTESTTTSGTGSTTGTTSTGTGGGPAKPQPPVFETLKPSTNGTVGLVLTWTEPTPCDVILIDWKDGLTPYPEQQQTDPTSPLYSYMTPGSNLTYTDTAATKNENYTYRLRCQNAGVNSDFSAEQSANPTMMGP